MPPRHLLVIWANAQVAKRALPRGGQERALAGIGRAGIPWRRGYGGGTVLGVALGQTRVPARGERRSALYLGALRPSSNTKVWLVWPPPSVPPWTPPGLRVPSGSGMRAGGGSDPEPREKAVGRGRRLLRHSALKYTFLSLTQRKKGTFQGRGSGACPGAPPAGRAGNGRGFERSWGAGASPHPHPGSASIGVPRLPNTEKPEGAQSHRDLRGDLWTLVGRCCIKRTSDGESPAGSCVALSCWAEQHLCPDPLPPRDNSHSSETRTETCLSVSVTPGRPAGPGERVRALHPEARVTASCHLPLSALTPMELLLHRQREGGRADPPPPSEARAQEKAS